MTRIGNLIRDPVDLKQCAAELNALAPMLDRITKKDIQTAAQALLDSAQDIAYLLSGKHKPVGCPCRLIENDNNGTCYLIYEDACFHHKHLKAYEEQLKASYEAAEKKLANTVRLQLLTAVLSAAVTQNVTLDVGIVVRRAFQIVDATLEALHK